MCVSVCVCVCVCVRGREREGKAKGGRGVENGATFETTLFRPLPFSPSLSLSLPRPPFRRYGQRHARRPPSATHRLHTDVAAPRHRPSPTPTPLHSPFSFRRYVRFCMRRIAMLIHYGVTPVMVFDGACLPSKAGEEKERKKSVPALVMLSPLVPSMLRLSLGLQPLSLSLLSLLSLSRAARRGPWLSFSAVALPRVLTAGASPRTTFPPRLKGGGRTTGSAVWRCCATGGAPRRSTASSAAST